MADYGKIITFEDLNRIRDTLGRIVCTSGGFDPLHPGHATCIVDSKDHGDTLVIVVNGDAFLRGQEGQALHGSRDPLQDRCLPPWG